MNHKLLLSLLLVYMVFFPGSAFAESVPETLNKHDQQIQQLFQELENLKKQVSSSPSAASATEKPTFPVDLILFPPESFENCIYVNSSSIKYGELKRSVYFNGMIIEKEVQVKTLPFDMSIRFRCDGRITYCVGRGYLNLEKGNSFIAKVKRVTPKNCKAFFEPTP